MKLMNRGSWFMTCISIACTAMADEIKVSPGPGALGAAVAKAKSGDTVKVGAGEYAESVVVTEGVTIEGAGADTTTLVATEYAAINCRGGHVRISGLTIKGGEKTMRGVNTSLPVRVERCRFVGVKEGVALMEAPLSDVVACDFVDCGIGVRAIGGACPTVWACRFKGGMLGVFSMDGSPYIRDNVFDGNKTGVRMVPHDVQPAIIRNNLFVHCAEGAIVLMPGKRPLFGPSIRNNVFDGCGAAVTTPKALAGGTSHALVHGVAAPAFRGEDGAEALLSLGQRSLAEGDAGVTVADDGTVTIAHAEHVDGKGIRLCSDKEGAQGTIGLEKEWRRVGTGTTGSLPAARFGGKRLVANSVGEEYQYLRVLGRPRGSQSLSHEDGVPVDSHDPGDGREPKQIVFDISRFFGEDGIKP